MNARALRVEGLALSYGKVRVLDGVSFDVAAGGCTAVLGPSGCGKSTLLRTVAGLVSAERGRIEIGGTLTDDPVSRVPPERRGVGFVFQDLALWPHVSVRKNLAFVLAARGVGGSDADAAAERACDDVGLDRSLLERRPGELSGGERQRAAIARVLVQTPNLLLLDEPLTNLDRALRVQVLALLRRLRQEHGLAALLVTHDRDEAFALADRVVVLRDGRVEQEGTPQEVYAAPRSAYVASLVGTVSLVPAQRRDGAIVTALGSWPVTAGDGAATSGPVLAVFRPETVRLSEAGSVRGRCVDAFYRGDHWLHEVDVEGPSGSVMVLVRAASPERPGAALRLTADRPAFVPVAESPR